MPQLTLHESCLPDITSTCHITWQEALSEPFFGLVDITTSEPLDVSHTINQSIGLSTRTTSNQTQIWHGIITDIRACNVLSGHHDYQLTLSPTLWLLSLDKVSRVFQHRTVIDIVTQIFDEFGLSDYDSSQLQGQYDPIDYCVQYHESTFHFISRLLAKYGVYYYFTYSQSKHTLILCDNKSTYVSTSPATLRCDELKPSDLQSWFYTTIPQSYEIHAIDYNPSLPTEPFAAQASYVAQTIPDSEMLPIYLYPCGAQTTSQAQYLATIHADRLACEQVRAQARSSLLGLAPGQRFELTHQNKLDQNGAYLITQVNYDIYDASYYTHDDAPTHEILAGLSVIPADKQFRPLTKAAPLKVNGIHTARVVGPEGSSIYSNSKGQIKIQHHWDLEGNFDHNSSCWVRVSTPWGGQGWGMIFTPRIDQEVLIKYLFGDLDRPIVIGCAYNTDHRPPVPLSNQSNFCGFWSQIIGSTDRGHSINFDNTAYNERISLKSAGDLYQSIGKDYIIQGEFNISFEIDGDYSLSITEGRASISADDSITLQAGSNSILVNQAGIYIHTTLLDIRN